MENLTYQQILAQQYRENAELEEEEVEDFENPEVEVRDTHPDEIEDKDGYNKPGHNFGDSIIQKPPVVYDDKTTAGVKYLAKDILRTVVSVDSRFRENPSTTLSTNFHYKLQKPLKNVTSIRLSSIEFPNTSYMFTKEKHNISFQVLYPDTNTGAVFRTITIDEGSYDDAAAFTSAIQDVLNATISSDLQVALSLVTGKVTISSITNVPFQLDFTTPYNAVNTTLNINGVSTQTQNSEARSFDTGLGYNLGFRGILNEATGIRNQVYSGASTYTSESIVISIDSNYVFLSLGNDFPVMTHQYNTYDHITAFAKIFLTVPSFGVIFDTGQNTVTQSFHFKKPHNIRDLHVKIFDVYGKIVNTNGIDFSFTLEVDEILSNSLYHTLTEGT